LLGKEKTKCFAQNLMWIVWIFANWEIESRYGRWILGVNFSPPIPGNEVEGVVEAVGIPIAIDS
jgi:hypothetical protein